MSKPLPFTLFIAVFISSIILSGTGCKKTSNTTTNVVPSVTTTGVILDVTSTTAQSGGTITAIGTDAITVNGVCYSTTNTVPTISDTKNELPVSTTTYSFVCNLTGLTPNTKYYLRAYATSAIGTGYGSVISFTTSSDLTSVIGTVTTFAGSGSPGYLDETGTSAQFYNPLGAATDAAGNVYIADAFNNRIRKITPTGVVTTIAGNGAAGLKNGDALSAEFYYPHSIALDAAGNIYVSDYGNNVIRKITVSTGTVSTFAGIGTSGYTDGAGTVAQFSGPSGLAFDKSGNLFVADGNNNIIRKITPAAVVSYVAGTNKAGYFNATTNTTTGVYASFNGPDGIAIDQTSGNIYVADLGNNAIRQITTAGVVTTIAGGPVQNALIGYAAGIAVDKDGNLFITDESGRIIEITSEKVLYPLAGAANVNGYFDGAGTDAKFSTPQGIAVDQSGNIYVTDFNNNRIRKVVVTTVHK